MRSAHGDRGPFFRLFGGGDAFFSARIRRVRNGFIIPENPRPVKDEPQIGRNTVSGKDLRFLCFLPENLDSPALKQYNMDMAYKKQNDRQENDA